jgi:transposase
MSGNTSRRYPPELRERAVRMVGEIRADHESEWAAMNKIAELLGVGSGETVRKWLRQNEIDAGARQESAEVKQLRRENAELKRANAILKAASAFFAAELDRPSR